MAAGGPRHHCPGLSANRAYSESMGGVRFQGAAVQVQTGHAARGARLSMRILHEVERDDYLVMKHREYQRQQVAQ